MNWVQVKKSYILEVLKSTSNFGDNETKVDDLEKIVRKHRFIRDGIVNKDIALSDRFATHEQMFCKSKVLKCDRHDIEFFLVVKKNLIVELIERVEYHMSCKSHGKAYLQAYMIKPTGTTELVSITVIDDIDARNFGSAVGFDYLAKQMDLSFDHLLSFADASLSLTMQEI